MKTRYTYKAEAKTINIEGEIDSSWGVGLSALRYDLQGAEDVTIYVNSGGGSVTEGFAIADTLAMHAQKHNVEIIGVGIVASIATMILAAGTKGSRKMTENSFLMIHNPWAGVMGESKDLRSTADTLDSMREKLIQNYLKVIASNNKTTTREQIEDWMNEEKFFTAQEALEVGLIDDIVETMEYITPENVSEVEAQAKAFQRPPVALMNKIKEVKTMNNTVSKDEISLFGRFFSWISKQFSNSLPAAESDKEQPKEEEEKVEETLPVENEIDNKQNSDTMEKEELVKKLAEIGYEMEPEEEKEEMSEEELLKMAEEMGMKPKKKEEVKAENKLEAMLKAQAEEIARLKAAQTAPKLNTEPKEVKNKTRQELAIERIAKNNEGILNSWGEKYFN